MALSRDPHTLTITLENIQPHDAIALIKMFEHMQYLGEIGSSRKCTFFADGDGSFHPKIKYKYPIQLPDVSDVVRLTGNNIFSIDSDDVAWKIYHDE